MNCRLSPPTLTLLALLVASLAGACSLLVEFDPEGKPCNSEHICLDGYSCVGAPDGAFLCISSDKVGDLDAGLPDAG